ncbi:hypothetical protein IFM89_029736 [Coptis chinensis]|uniref:Uncharacterized protein n=1 Tax=Coptis chinensis TaxID=261450 RepID=A0A835I7A5_9MAGN|nr:hypothetical protein IFM89_029736 [Coptis chinensis]
MIFFCSDFLEVVLKEVVDLESKFLKLLGFMWNPLSWVMEAAAIMSIALANGGGKPPDWGVLPRNKGPEEMVFTLALHANKRSSSCIPYKTEVSSRIDNLLMSLIGGIPIAMPTALSGHNGNWFPSPSSTSLSSTFQGAITKRMTKNRGNGGHGCALRDKTEL